MILVMTSHSWLFSFNSQLVATIWLWDVPSIGFVINSGIAEFMIRKRDVWLVWYWYCCWHWIFCSIWFAVSELFTLVDAFNGKPKKKITKLNNICKGEETTKNYQSKIEIIPFISTDTAVLTNDVTFISVSYCWTFQW